MILGFVLTMILYKDDAPVKKETGNKTSSKTGKQEMIVSPLQGEVEPLSELKDEVFASGALGNGIAIVPSVGKVYAPCDGTISNIIDTGHAMGILSDNGAEILIHIGMDTVKLKGDGFIKKVEKGDVIKKGQLLLEFDIDKIKKAGYSIASPIVITNMSDYTDVIPTDARLVTPGDTIITVL